MQYKISKYIYDFCKFQKIRNFAGNIYNGKITTSEADQRQLILLNTILDFCDKARPISKADKEKKALLMKVQLLFMKAET